MPRALEGRGRTLPYAECGSGSFPNGLARCGCFLAFASRLPLRGIARSGKKPSGNRTKKEAANVSGIGYAAALDVGQGTNLVEELDDEPYSNQEKRRDKAYASEPAKEPKGLYLIARRDHDECAHYASDGAARSQAGQRRLRCHRCLCQCSRQPAEQIKRGVLQAPHGIFHSGAECVQKNHVAQNVQPSRMQKLRRQKRNPMVARDDFCWYLRPLHHKLVAIDALEDEDGKVEADDCRGGDGKAYPPSRQ